MSRAVVATAFGGPEVLALVDEDVAAPQAGQVLLEVRAAGVNPIDWKLYSGAFGRDSSTLPRRVGLEVAGVVLAVGEGATGAAGPLSVGDEVIAYEVKGGYAERLVVEASNVFPRPSAMSWEQAGALMLTGVTAVHTLTATEVDAGETVLVHGGAGGVGLMAVQIAVARGARVIATASEPRHGYLRSLGAEPVAYGEGLLDRVRAIAPGGVDAAVDAVGTDEAIDVSLELVSGLGRIATIAAFGRASEAGFKALGGGPGADPGRAVRDAARFELIRLAEAGRLQVLARSFPLEQAAMAHREGAEGHSVGKIVLVP